MCVGHCFSLRLDTTEFERGIEKVARQLERFVERFKEAPTMPTKQPISDAYSYMEALGGKPVWRIRADMGVLEMWLLPGRPEEKPRQIILHRLPGRAGTDIYETMPLGEGEVCETFEDVFR